VPVRGGAPPASGPPILSFPASKRVRFKVDTDIPIGLDVPGAGVTRVVQSGTSSVSFAAPPQGQFPLVVTGSNIEIATLRIGKRG